MLLEESRGRYLLSGASVTFVIRYGAIGDAPKRSRKKRQDPERQDPEDGCIIFFILFGAAEEAQAMD